MRPDETEAPYGYRSLDGWPGVEAVRTAAQAGLRRPLTVAKGASGFDRVRSNVGGVDWPPISTGFASVLASLMARLEETQWTDPADIAENQRAQLVRVAAHCAKHSKHFRARLAKAKLKPDELGEKGGLAQLPPLSRREFQSGSRDFYCAEVPPEHMPVSENFTSGSTGEPVVTRRTNVTQLFWMALGMRDHLWHRREFGRRAAMVRALPGQPGRPPRRDERADDWGPPVDALFRTGPALSINSLVAPKDMLELLTEFQPDSVLIYPNLLGGLLDLCRESGAVPPRIPHLRTTGETLSPELREAASALFRGKVEDSYTSQELGYIAIECPESGLYHAMAENVIVEVLDAGGKPCREGETGRLVITDLHNFATPLIRYDIADYAEVAAPCSCGRGLPTLKRVLGRERNLMLLPDGTRQWPRTGFHRFRDHAPIRQFQFVQLDNATIEVRLVADAPVTPAQEAELRAAIADGLRHPFELRFVYFDGQIPRGANGKFEDFLCLATSATP
jgi:phenylacetate-CoA ligase